MVSEGEKGRKGGVECVSVYVCVWSESVWRVRVMSGERVVSSVLSVLLRVHSEYQVWCDG